MGTDANLVHHLLLDFIIIIKLRTENDIHQKPSKPYTHELFTNDFDATKNVNIEELHCKYFDGRFYRFSLSAYVKKPNTALPTIYGKAICHLLI